MDSKVVDIDDVIGGLDPKNTRGHGEESAGAILKSLKAFGAARSVVMDGEGVIRAGNGTLSQAKAAGIKKVRIVKGDRGTLVVVQRSDLTGDQAQAYAIADNRVGELSYWDTEELQTAMESLRADEFDLGTLGFSKGDLDEMFGELKDESDIPRGDMPQVRVAQLYLDAESHPLFEERAKVLSVKMGLSDASEVVLECLKGFVKHFRESQVDSVDD